MKDERAISDAIGRHPDGGDGPDALVSARRAPITDQNADPRVRVRAAGSRRSAPQSDFDAVPCAMRLTMPGTERMVNPVRGRPNGVSRNSDVLVWCNCMAQTAEQHRIATEVRDRQIDPDSVAWPIPKHQRGWDVLGAVSVKDRDSTDQTVRMWREHRDARARLIRERSPWLAG